MSVTMTNLSQDLAQLAETVRARAAELLSSGEVRLVIGHSPAWTGPEAVPHFATTPADTAALVVGPQCAAMLAKYLLDEAEHDGTVAIVARGCDALGVRRLLVDKRIKESDVLILGVPCAGRIDPAKLAASVDLAAGEVAAIELDGQNLRIRRAGRADFEPGPVLAEVLAPPCLVCDVRQPEGCAEVLGADLATLTQIANAPPARTWEDWQAEVDELSARNDDDRYEYWSGQFQACLRCFACRNACPACNCRVCSLDSYEPKWLGHPTELPEQFMFHFIRATDVAGRCVACGECERVCPAGLPLMNLNLKLMQDIRSLFGVERPHVPQDIEPLGQFEPEDPEEFM